MKKFLLIPVLLFLGCSSKNEFIPENSKKKVLLSKADIKYLQDYTKKTLTFKELKLKYVKKENFLDDGVRAEWVYFDENNKELGKFKKINKDLAVNGEKLLILTQKKLVKLPYMVASATKNSNLIAIVFENNSIGIYDLKKQKLIFYRENDPVIVTKYLKASPVFYNELILFPLLTSQIGIYDLKTNDFIRNIDLSDDNLINNIIYLNIVNNQLFMATPNKIVLFDPNYLIDFKGAIKHVINDDKYIYLFMVDGKVIKFDTNLKKVKEINLPFADFFAPEFCKGDIYTVTYNKYLIKITKDLNVSVYSGNDFDTSEPLKIKDCKIYNSDKVYFLE